MIEISRLHFDAICKNFGTTAALDDVSFQIKPGEIFGLLGENGAGKSTLLKILCGIIAPSSGCMFVDGKRLVLRRPQDARAAGIAMIHQELQQIARLSVAQNMFLGNAITRLGGFLTAHREQERCAAKILAELDPTIDPGAPVGSLKVAQRQIVEIARALLVGAKIIAMDEPTSSLTQGEFEKLQVLITKLAKEKSVSIIYVSHKMNEIFDTCQRSAIMRDGKLMAVVDMKQTSREEIVTMMVGRHVMQEKHRSCKSSEVRLQAIGLHSKKINNVSLTLNRGEVLGIAGLVGSGRTELLRLLAGVDKAASGQILIDGEVRLLKSPRAAIVSGIGLLPEERKRDGLLLDRSVALNVALPSLPAFRKVGMLQRHKLREVAADSLKRVALRPLEPERPARLFSGGNQQKVIIARWLVCQSDILLFDEPTRGIDIGAKTEIYHLIEKLAAEGRAIIVVSSELPEIIRLADTVIVMREGAIAGILSEPAAITEKAIIELAMSANKTNAEQDWENKNNKNGDRHE